VRSKKAPITEAETLVFEGRVVSQTRQMVMKPGEFHFRPNVVRRAVCSIPASSASVTSFHRTAVS
jgi:hypothetical protein